MVFWVISYYENLWCNEPHLITEINGVLSHTLWRRLMVFWVTFLIKIYGTVLLWTPAINQTVGLYGRLGVPFMNDTLESTWNEGVVICSTYCSDTCLEWEKKITKYITQHVPSTITDASLCHCCYGQFLHFRERCSVVHYFGLFSAAISTWYCRQSNEGLICE